VPDQQRLVVPFRALTSAPADVASVIFERLGLPPLTDVDEESVEAHQNNVVTFRNETVRRAARRLRHSRANPVVRRAVGPRAMKRIRSLVTRVPDMPSVDDALRSCREAEREALADVADRAYVAVQSELERQDESLGLAWSSYWAPPRTVTPSG
jgi:predicted Fe-Mo cluster-binding NifX family protein